MLPEFFAMSDLSHGIASHSPILASVARELPIGTIFNTCNIIWSVAL